MNSRMSGNMRTAITVENLANSLLLFTAIFVLLSLPPCTNLLEQDQQGCHAEALKAVSGKLS